MKEWEDCCPGYWAYVRAGKDTATRPRTIRLAKNWCQNINNVERKFLQLIDKHFKRGVIQETMGLPPGAREGRALYGPVTSIATPAGFLTHVQEI